MQLSVARLCLDCEEIHEHERCPICTSEAFAYVTRWVKVDAHVRNQPQRGSPPESPEKLQAYREMLDPDGTGTRTSRWIRNGGVLLAAGYLARWGWLTTRAQGPVPPRSETPGRKPTE
jgi:hypothetical protein